MGIFSRFYFAAHSEDLELNSDPATQFKVLLEDFAGNIFQYCPIFS